MPVPRRFDRRPPERDLTRINERIRVPEVRLIGDDGAQLGVMKIDDALAYAQERDLDLVEVAPEAKPPVCRVLDYSKYKYEQAQKVKQARKHQQQITIREIKFRPKIAQHDYDTKKGHVERFLRHKDKVKVTIMFRGREVTHPERGVLILDRLAEELAEFATIEQRPLHDGRNMTMMLGPSKAVLAGQYDKGAIANGDGAVVALVGGPPSVSEVPSNGAIPSASAAEQAPQSEMPSAGVGETPASESVPAAAVPVSDPEPAAVAPSEPVAVAPATEDVVGEPAAAVASPAPAVKPAPKAKPAASKPAAAKAKSPAKPAAKPAGSASKAAPKPRATAAKAKATPAAKPKATGS